MPSIYYYKEREQETILVMELVGPSLEQVFQAQTYKKIEEKSVANIMFQIVTLTYTFEMKRNSY